MNLEKPNTLKRYDCFDADMMEQNRAITIVRKGQREFLSGKATVYYYESRKPFLTYLLRIGKTPETAKGYSPYTVSNTANRTAHFDTWVWHNRGGYKTLPDEDEAHAYMEEVAFRDVSDSTKGKNQEATEWGTTERGQPVCISGGPQVNPNPYRSLREELMITRLHFWL